MSDAAGRSDLAPTDPSSKAWIKALRPSSVSSVLSEGPRRKLPGSSDACTHSHNTLKNTNLSRLDAQ